jgi:FkbM family methyltransferase
MGKSQQEAGENELVWQALGCRSSGFFVDVGAHDPRIGSQTWFLEEKGWSGILIEPQSRLCEKLRQARPRSRVFQVACGAPGQPEEMQIYIAEASSHSSLVRNLIDPSERYVASETVKVKTLDALLAEAGEPRLDFVSIDVEGTQLDVLRGFTLERYRPSLLLIEDHLHNLKVHRYLTRQGYRLVKRTGLNNWYVPRESSFDLTGGLERLRLWKKVWANTPIRKLRVWVKRRSAVRKMSD